MIRKLLALAIFTPLVISAVQPATWYFPGPSGHTLAPYSGWFTDGQIGYSVSNTDPSNILKSLDGGATWFPLATYPGLPLASIHFPRYQTGFAVSASQLTLLRTRNAGTTWTRLDAPRKLNNLHFVSDQVGFALGDTTTLLKSVDGGESWQEIHLPKNALRIFFFTERLGFFVTNSADYLLKTYDGGETWHSLPESPNVREMDFFDPYFGIATAKDSMNNAVIYKSVDEGLTWIPILTTLYSVVNPPTNPFPATFDYGNPNVVSSSKVYITYKTRRSCPGCGPTSEVLKSTDGGATWTTTYFSYTAITSLQFPDSTTGYIKARRDDFETGGPPQGYFLRYRDLKPLP